MLCSEKCPRNHIDCTPISNLVSDCKTSFVCVGLNKEESRSLKQDKFRHCFKSAAGTDSLFDYDEYDLKSVIGVMSEALLIDEMEKVSR